MDRIVQVVNLMLYLVCAVGLIALVAAVLSGLNTYQRRRDGKLLVDMAARILAVESGQKRVLEIVAPLAPKPPALPVYSPPARDSAEPTYPTPPGDPRGTMVPNPKS